MYTKCTQNGKPCFLLCKKHRKASKIVGFPVPCLAKIHFCVHFAEHFCCAKMFNKMFTNTFLRTFCLQNVPKCLQTHFCISNFAQKTDKNKALPFCVHFVVQKCIFAQQNVQQTVGKGSKKKDGKFLFFKEYMRLKKIDCFCHQ